MAAIINIYLNFAGNCEEAFNFYKSVFGGEFAHISRFSDMPPQDGMPELTPEQANGIMHVSLPISRETVLMGSDAGGDWAPTLRFGNNFTISVTTHSQEEADRIFNGLAAGGKITMPLNKTFWGDYFGMLEDKFGVNWMMSYNESYNFPE